LAVHNIRRDTGGEVRKEMGTIKQEITWDLGPEIITNPNPNSWGRRNFSLYIEGSYGYDGEKKYEQSKQFILVNKKNTRKMRAFAIRNFTEMVAFEYSCSYGYAQKCIVGLTDKDTLASYTNLLIADAIDQFN